MHLGFFCLVFLLNLICNIFHLFIGIILITNLLTELDITHNIFTAFDINPSLEVCSIFLDLFKAFDRVWHKGLIHKVKNNRINGNLLSLIESFLHNRYQSDVLNGQSSKWQKLNTGGPQGSVLGSRFFFIYINNLPQDLHSDLKLFADDTSLFSVIYDVDA